MDDDADDDEEAKGADDDVLVVAGILSSVDWNEDAMFEAFAILL